MPYQPPFLYVRTIMVSKRLFFLYGCLLFLGISIARSQVNVQLEGLPFGKKRFSVVAFKDYLSLAPEFLAETTTVENNTTLSFPLENSRWVRITGMGVSHDIIAMPGKTYRLRMQQDEAGDYLEHLTNALPADDPNKLCDSVNVLVNTYLYKYNSQLFSGVLAKKTAIFCDSVEKAFVASPDALFQLFLSFRLDELRLLARTWPEQAMYKNRFEGKVFQPENPDYAYAFSEFYKGRLPEILLKHKMAYGKQLINDFKGADTLVKWIAQEPFYQGEAGEGALLLGLTELMKDKNYSRDGILVLFNQFSQSSKYPAVKNVAARLYKKFRIPVNGEQAPALRVEDKAGNIIDVGLDKTRKTYLCFFDPQSEVTASELAAINELKKELKDRIIVVPVVINADKQTLSSLQKNNKLTFELYRNIESSTLSDFRLKNDCTCLVLSPDGKYVMPQAPLPSAPNANTTLGELSKTGR